MTAAITLARRSKPDLASALELLKPVTWFPPMWAFACGTISAGGVGGLRWLAVIGGVLLAGPFVCGTSQAINDWFDRHVDAINEPQRPIPSGRIPGRWGLFIAIGCSLLSLLLAAALGRLILGAAVVALVLAWAYSAPPVRLKLNGWWGNAAVAACYEGLPWFTGAAVASGHMPTPIIVALAVLYSIGAHGIMTLNDFKAIEGDRRLGVRSLPVQLGVTGAARWACFIMLLPQFAVVGLLWLGDHRIAAGLVAALMIGQVGLMRRFLGEPVKHALWFSATAVSLYVSGMMCSAVALAIGGGQ